MFSNLELEMSKSNVSAANIANFLGISEETTGNLLATGELDTKAAAKIWDRFFPEQSLDYLFKCEGM